MNLLNAQKIKQIINPTQSELLIVSIVCFLFFLRLTCKQLRCVIQLQVTMIENWIMFLLFLFFFYCSATHTQINLGYLNEVVLFFKSVPLLFTIVPPLHPIIFSRVATFYNETRINN